jgi:hypothetical protein
MAYWQRIVIAEMQNYNSYLPSVMDFAPRSPQPKFSVEMKVLGTRDDKTHDNFFRMIFSLFKPKQHFGLCGESTTQSDQ